MKHGFMGVYQLLRGVKKQKVKSEHGGSRKAATKKRAKAKAKAGAINAKKRHLKMQKSRFLGRM